MIDIDMVEEASISIAKEQSSLTNGYLEVRSETF